MLKKSCLLLSIAFGALFTQTSVAQYHFNPEEIYFSKISTLKSWVAEKYYISEGKKGDKFLKSVQHLVAKTLRQNPEAYRLVFPIQNDPELKQNYGNSLLTIEEMELLFFH